MKIIQYTEADARRFDGGPAKGITGRVVIGQADNARNFCMRVFEIEPDGYTPRHTHDWEHEIFFHAGQGEIFRSGEWVPVQAGYIAFVPGNEEHQIRNTGDTTLVFACLVPAGAPEI